MLKWVELLKTGIYTPGKVELWKLGENDPSGKNYKKILGDIDMVSGLVSMLEKIEGLRLPEYLSLFFRELYSCGCVGTPLERTFALKENSAFRVNSCDCRSLFAFGAGIYRSHTSKIIILRIEC